MMLYEDQIQDREGEWVHLIPSAHCNCGVRISHAT